MIPFETVYLDPPQGEGSAGNFYDKAEEPGVARHVLGRYRVTRQYMIRRKTDTPMVAVRLWFDSGEKATGKSPLRSPYKVLAYQFKGESWDQNAP
jgi:hypothetical protein